MKFSDIEDAFLFVGSGQYGENSAILCKSTGHIYYRSEYGDIDDDLPDEEFDPNIHVHIPHKNELGLGKDLVFEFVEQHIPDEYHTVNDIFRKRGAYSRFKALLGSKGLLESWYEFENQRVKTAIIQWCQTNGIHVIDLAA